ncbi:MAG: hypothetical protein HRT52_14880 [Colwellia sp.]|nr:hypothetical protein [Colwellia sp.]
MSALAYSTNKSDKHPSVTTISASARIDYIFRFSKQAILVINDDLETFAQIGSEYIATLPDEQNTAFVSISPKLNNIQIRCRIIEQLFGNSLFDPEQSLAVSIINFSKIETDAISIVIENAELLSLQLLHELCQLSEIAKKTKRNINVLLLGAKETGTEMARNRSLFDHKVSILSAQSGQLISLGSKKLKTGISFLSFGKAKKIWLTAFVSLLVIVSLLVVLQQRQSIDFSELIEQNFNENNEIVSTFVLTKKNKSKIDKAIKDKAKGSIIDKELVISEQQGASRNDILQAIVTSEVNEINTKEEPITRSSINLHDDETIEGEVVKSITIKLIEPQAISSIKNNTQVVVAPISKETPFRQALVKTVKSVTTDTEPLTNNNEVVYSKINSENYINKNTGFVVQIAGFSQFSVFEEFINEYANIDYLGYYRNLNQQKFLVITSLIFPSRFQAEQALISLPIELQERGSWIKSIEAVNSEIQQYQQSN